MKTCKTLLILPILTGLGISAHGQTIVNGDFSSTANVNTAPFRAVAGSDVFSYGRPAVPVDNWQLGDEQVPAAYLGWTQDTVNDYANATLTQAYIDGGGVSRGRVMYYYTALPSVGTYDFSYDYETGSDIDGIRDGLQVQLGFVPEGFQLTRDRNLGDNWFTSDNGSTTPTAIRAYDSGTFNSGSGGIRLCNGFVHGYCVRCFQL